MTDGFECLPTSTSVINGIKREKGGKEMGERRNKARVSEGEHIFHYKYILSNPACCDSGFRRFKSCEMPGYFRKSWSL